MLRRKRTQNRRQRRGHGAPRIPRPMPTRTVSVNLFVTKDVAGNAGLTVVNQVEDLRNHLFLHDDFANFTNLYGRVRVPSVELTYHTAPSASAAYTSLLVGCYDSDNGTNLLTFASGESFAKKLYLSDTLVNPQHFKFTTEPGDFPIVNTNTFNTGKNIIGYWKWYSSVTPTGRVRGYVTIKYHIIFMDRK